MLFNEDIFENINLNLTIEKPKNPKNNPETWYVNEKIFDNYNILYIVEKVLKSSIQ